LDDHVATWAATYRDTCALLFLAGVRFGEASALRWRHYDAERKPLGRLSIAKSYSTKLKAEKEVKTKVPRDVPVHPVLASLLAEWKLSGWLATFGRTPERDDLIIPSRLGKNRSANHMLKKFHQDLGRLGIPRSCVRDSACRALFGARRWPRSDGRAVSPRTHSHRSRMDSGTLGEAARRGPLVVPLRLKDEQVARGVIITIADRIVVCLHLLRAPVLRGPAHGLIGGSDGVEAVRRKIGQVADLEYPVLLRGESGTGKEMVARAIAASSGRKEPFVAINMANLRPPLPISSGTRRAPSRGRQNRGPGFSLWQTAALSSSTKSAQRPSMCSRCSYGRWSRGRYSL